MMRRFLITAFTSACIISAATASATAQQGGRGTGPGDVINSAPVPAPEDGNIIVRFQEATRIYFKRAVKLVKLDDDLAVKAHPITDHVIEFTGLAPGKSMVTIESTDGSKDSWPIVTVVRDLHPVRIYQKEHTGIGGYVIFQCNEIICDEPEPAPQPKSPR